MIGFVGIAPQSLGFIGIIPSIVLIAPFAPDFEQFFQINIKESSAQVTIRHPLFEQRIERPAIAIWIPD